MASHESRNGTLATVPAHQDISGYRYAPDDGASSAGAAAYKIRRPSSNEAVPLICLPFAGAGPSFFNDWIPLANARLEIAAISFPGREKRYFEEPYRDVGAAATGILPEVLARVGDRDQVIIFGHSLGAVLAYELCHRLKAARGIQISNLIVSGSPGPWSPRAHRATGLDDEGFLDQVSKFAGYSHPALSDPDLRDMLLPALRADVEMHENYYPASDHPLDCAITSVRGAHDELVSYEEAAEWQKATTAPLKMVELPGGHMYLAGAPDRLLSLIEGIMTQTISAPCH